MFGIGIWELLLILIIVLFSRRLPEVGEDLAKGIRNFRRTMSKPDEIDVTPKERSDKERDKKGGS